MRLWVVCQDVIKSLDQISQPSMQIAAKQAGLENNEWQGWLFPAYAAAPEDISVYKLRIHMPYAHASFFESKLVKYARKGYLTGKDNLFFLTQSGMEAAENILQARWEALSTFHLTSPKQSRQLADFLEQITRVCHDSIEPHSKWCLLHNRRQPETPASSALVRIDQYLSDLCAWRDDCHLASWQPFHYLHGHVWEVFTFLWQENNHTLDEICDQLCLQRGFSRLEYMNAIKELEIRGWVLEEEGIFSLTVSGRKVRQSAEDYTDELFFPPFQTLSAHEQKELSDLLSSLHQQLINR
jgi:hypothetical protein